jgi:hypothetical protein
MDATQNLRTWAVIAVFLVAFGGHQVAHAWLGSTQDEAARSAMQILNAGASMGNGVYWIDPNGGDTADASQVFCDMTADGGGWMLAVNSIAGEEPPTNDMASNTGAAGPGSAHTRDMSFWAIGQDAEIRHEIVDNNNSLLFHAKYTGKYHDAMPNFAGWTTLSGHVAGSETMIAYHFGWLWSTVTNDNDGSPGNCAATYGAPWYYNNCWTILPSRPDNGLAQGPERMGIGVIDRYSIYVRELSTPSQTVSSNGTGGGGFGDPCTWAGGIVPGPVDTAVIVSGDTVTLDSDFTVDGLSIEAGAIFDEATSSMTIVEGGPLVNNGIIRVSRSISGTGPVDFGLGDVSMDITTQGTLSQIQVDRIDSNHPEAYGKLLSGIHWSIVPTGSGYTLELTLPHSISPDSSAHLARHEGGGIWTLGRTSSTATHVTLEAVTQLSDWTVCKGPSTIYVDADASAGGNGQSWATAYKYLQDALAVAMADDQIWVAEGTYKPDASTANPVGTSERAATFQVINGVGIYGGYAGYWAADPNERDIELYETVLSGDINAPGDNSDNSYHVVTAIGTDADAVLDGLTITDGNASGSWPSATALGGGMLNMSNSSHRVTNCTFSRNFAESGSGMWNDTSSPTLTNCTFSRNSARANGSGMFNWASSPTIVNCTFSGNSAYSGAGMLNNVGSSPTLTNCTFTGNLAESTGGGIYNGDDSLTVTNCTFSGNSAGSEGGGMHNLSGSMTVTNCILWGNTAPNGPQIYGPATVNYSDVEGGWPGTENIDEDPLLIDPNGLDGIPGTADDEEGCVHLRGYSPCINAGDPGGDYSGQIDIDGQPRVAYGRVDMGADEVFPAAGDYEPDGDVDFADFARIAQDWLLGAQ